MSEHLASSVVGIELPQTSSPIQPNEPVLMSPAGSSDSPNSPESVAKRWALKFKSAAVRNSSTESLGDLRSASFGDLNLVHSQSIIFSLHLSVSVQDTKLGDRVILSGNCEALGMWIAEQSPSLSTSAETFPFWSIDIRVEMKRCLMPLEFKFAIVRNHTGFVDWESGIPNRVIWASSESISITHIVFNVPLPAWVKSTKPIIISEALSVRCKRPSDRHKVDWICSCPSCNQTSAIPVFGVESHFFIVAVSHHIRLVFHNRESGCMFSSVLIVHSAPVPFAEFQEAECEELAFGSVSTPASPAAIRNKLILAAYASQAFDSSAKRFRPIGGKPLNNPLLDCHWRASATISKALAVSGVSIGEESVLLSLPSLNVSCDASGKSKSSQESFCKLFVARRNDLSLESLQWNLRHQHALSSVLADTDGARPTEIVQVDVSDLLATIQNVGRDSPSLGRSLSGERLITLPDAEIMLGPRTGSLLLRDPSLSPYGKVCLLAQSISNGGNTSIVLDPAFVSMLRTPSGLQMLTSIRDGLI